MGELVTRKEKMETIKDLLERYKPQLSLALPRHLKADRMLRVYLNEFARVPKLSECTPASLIACLLNSSQLGLELGGPLGQSWPIPFNNRRTGKMEAQLIIGYKGLLDLARRSGEISTIQAHVVYSKDAFSYSFGLSPTLRHVPSDEEDRGQMTHVYAVVNLKDGATQWDVMTAREVEKIKKSSKASNDGPWVTHPEEMWKKTVLRRICKLLPASVELQKAVAIDELADVGLQNFSLPMIEAPTEIQVDPEENGNALKGEPSNTVDVEGEEPEQYQEAVNPDTGEIHELKTLKDKAGEPKQWVCSCGESFKDEHKAQDHGLAISQA